MANPSDILKDPNFVSANAATKQAIFDKHVAQDPAFTSANSETQNAIRSRFGLTSEQPQSFNVGKMAGNLGESLYKNTVGGLYEAVSSPLQTGQALADVVAGGAYNVMPKPFQRALTAIEASPYNPLGNPAALQRAQNVAGAVGKDYATDRKSVV